MVSTLSDIGRSARRAARLLTGMILLAGVPYSLAAQEFDCRVSINDRQISGSAMEHVRELAPALERYINENRWTEDRYEDHERIRCRIQIVFTDADSQFNFDADVIFQLRRPVYNTMQESVLAVLSDNWRFQYPRGQSLLRDEMLFDELTSFVDFYLYVMLGMDYDSFADLGGSRHYARALEVFDLAQVAGATGWSRGFGSQRNRYGLINDLTSPAYEELRRAIYLYHRHGLDRFTQQPDEARRHVIAALEQIGENRRRATNNYLFDIFFDTKYTELVSLFRGASPTLRRQAYELLRATDPGHSSEYERLVE